MAIGTEQIEQRFGHHKATIEGPEATLPRHETLRTIFKGVAEALDERLEDGREKSLAFTALEEASMWSHKALAVETAEQVSRGGN